MVTSALTRVHTVLKHYLMCLSLTGIGFGCTYTLLQHNIAKLFILSPRKEVFDGAKEVFAKELGEDKASRVEWIECDLSDWKATANVAEKIKKSTDRLDILINKYGGIDSYLKG
jgi:NAD(P)-dependent dehydrogenase (short-subunit alcohol dehydrogenase family)